MIDEEPPFYGSWKGRVIEAIALENIRDWVGIQEYTQLTEENLNKALSELYNLDIIDKLNDGTYWIKDIEVVHIYRNYFEDKDEYKTPLIPYEVQKEMILEKALPKDESLATFIVKWKDLKNLPFSLDARHFFLEGNYLGELCMDLIRRARKEILLVNPYIQECDLSKALLEKTGNKPKVLVITQPQKDYRPEVLKENQEFHEKLKNAGIIIHYDSHVHAKLLVVDQQIAVISSMNFIVTSYGGKTWEAGMISIDDSIVASVHKKIHERYCCPTY